MTYNSRRKVPKDYGDWQSDYVAYTPGEVKEKKNIASETTSQGGAIES